MDLQHLADLLLDRVQRVERGHRLLEDHRDLVAADLAKRRRRQRQQILALEQDRAGWVRGGGVGKESQDGERGHRLARARLADQCHGLGVADVERHVLDRVGDATRPS